VRCDSLPSTSKSSVFAASFSASWTLRARPSRTAIMPQHSLGKSRRAWATMRSMSSGAISTPRGHRPALWRAGGGPADRGPLLLALDGGSLVLVAVLVLARQRLLELAHALPERLAHLGQLLRPEHDQGDGENDDELHGADVRHTDFLLGRVDDADPTPVVARSRRSGLPPDRGVEVLDLLHGTRVDAARQVLPAVVAHDEDDVALVHLARDADGDRGDRAGGDAREHALLVEEAARPHDRVVVRDEDLPVEQAQVDDRRDEAVVEGPQALDRLALARLRGDGF